MAPTAWMTSTKDMVGRMPLDRQHRGADDRRTKRLKQFTDPAEREPEHFAAPASSGEGTSHLILRHSHRGFQEPRFQDIQGGPSAEFGVFSLQEPIDRPRLPSENFEQFG